MKQNNKVFFLDPPLQSDRLHEQVLCDEWRKVQSSATLFELNPGVGCWTRTMVMGLQRNFER